MENDSLVIVEERAKGFRAGEGGGQGIILQGN